LSLKTRSTRTPSEANHASATKEAGGRLAAFVSQYFGVGEAGGVVDCDVNELPTGDSALLAVNSRLVTNRAVAGDPMAGTQQADPPELLDVEVDELTWALALIAVRRLQRVEPRALAETDPLEHCRDGRQRHCKDLGDLGRGHPQAPECLDRLDAIGRRAVRDQVRGAAAVGEASLALLAPALEPAVGGALADAGGLGRRHQRPGLALDPLDEQLAAIRTGLGVTVNLHPESPWDWVASAPLSLQGGPDVFVY
jgi:hypothetical protein